MKASKYISALFSIALALLFLLSGSGIQFYLHQCDLKKTKELSLFSKNFSCDHEHFEANIHQHEKSSGCCSSTIEAFDNEGDNCCHTSSYFYKISSDFEKSSSVSTVHSPAILHLNTNPVTEDSLTEGTIINNNTLSPPPLFGFDRTITLHQLKIAYLA